MNYRDIQNIRKTNGITLGGVAKAIGNISIGYLSRLERGQQKRIVNKHLRKRVEKWISSFNSGHEK